MLGVGADLPTCGTTIPNNLWVCTGTPATRRQKSWPLPAPVQGLPGYTEMKERLLGKLSLPAWDLALHHPATPLRKACPSLACCR